MRRLTIILPILLSCGLYSAGLGAQAAKPKVLSYAQAERLSVELQQGMTLEEVQNLLGKPRRTALKSDGPAAAEGGVLQWTYAWSSVGQSEPLLHIMFTSKSSQRWAVTSWDWSAY